MSTEPLQGRKPKAKKSNSSAPSKKCTPTLQSLEAENVHLRESMEELLQKNEQLLRTLGERTQADEHLLTSQERLAAVVEAGRFGYSDWNIQTGEVLRNERWANMLGYTLAELKSKKSQWEELLHPDDREKAKISLQDHLDGKTPFHRNEYRLRTKDGSYRWILDQGKIIEYDEQGRPVRLTATHTDITERKLSEIKIQQQYAEVQTIYNISRQLQKLKNPLELAETVIATMEEYLEYEFGAILLVDKASQNLIPFAISDQGEGHDAVEIDKKLIASHSFRVGKGIVGWVAEHGESVRTGNTQNDPRYYGLRANIRSELCVPLHLIDEVIGVINIETSRADAYTESDQRILETVSAQISVAIQNSQLYEQIQQELTERKQVEEALRMLEEKYRTLVEFMPLVVYQDTAEERSATIYISPQVVNLLGYLPEDFKNNPYLWHDLIFPDDYELALNTIQETVEHENSKSEYRMVTKSRDVIWVRDTSVSVRDASGSLRFIQGFLEDITDRKQTVESLRKSEERLQAFFNQSLDGFFFCDFKEPLEWKHAEDQEETLEYILNNKRFTDVNDAMLQQYGITREHFLQLTTKDVFAHDPQQGRKLRRELFDKGHLHLETYERTSKGEPVWFEGDYVCLYDPEEHITGYFGIQRNITERKNTIQALRESEERYRTLFAGMLDGVYRSTHDGKFVDVNPAMVKMFGYSSREEMLEVDIKQELYFTSEERGSHILDTGQQETEVYRMRRKDGSEIWVEDHGSYVHDERGNVIYHEGILRDITERKLAEDALKRSEAFTKSIVENEPECVKIVSKGGILEYMNPAGLTMIEVDNLERVAGKSVYPIIDQKDRNAFMELTERVLSGEQGTLQFEIIGLKGTRRWLETHAVPLYNEHGNITSLLGLTRDITERKLAEDAAYQAEEKYRSIFENAIEGIYQSSPDGRFLTVNPAFAAIMGYASPQEMVASITDIANQLYIDASRRDDFMLLLEEEGSITGFEYRMRRKDGKMVWVSENSRLVRDESGKIHYYEGILEDITARKQNEQRLDSHLKQLKALHVIDNAINSNFDLRMTLEVLLQEVLAQFKVDAASVLLFNKDTHTLNYTAGRGFLSKATQHTKLSAGEGFAGRVIVERKTIHIPNLSKTDNRLTAALSRAGENFTAYVGSPLIAKGQVVGVLEIFQRSPLNPNPDWFEFLNMITDQAAIAIENAQLFENLQRSNFELTLAYDATIEGWSRALDLRDHETEGHTQRVTSLTIKLAQRMNIPDTEILHIRRGALLHDIGKMGIPDNILHKPDKLTAEEWDIMRQHTVYAYNMINPINYLKPALDIPRYHHERWDGTGYPEGLRGEQIPIAARIFAVVDVWDALASKRAYRDAWSKEKVAEYIRIEAGRHFDPRIVETFLSLIEEEDLS